MRALFLLPLILLTACQPIVTDASADPIGRCGPGRQCNVRTVKFGAPLNATTLSWTAAPALTCRATSLLGGSFECTRIVSPAGFLNSSGGSIMSFGTSDFRVVRSQVDAVDVASIVAGTCNDAAAAVTFTGTTFATATTTCTVVGSVAGIATDIVPYAWATDVTTVNIRLCCNNAAAACDPVSQNYSVTCIQ